MEIKCQKTKDLKLKTCKTPTLPQCQKMLSQRKTNEHLPRVIAARAHVQDTRVEHLSRVKDDLRLVHQLCMVR